MAEINGWLWKLGAKGVVKGWKKRWCSLKGPRLRYYKHREDGDFQGFIDLNTATGVSNTSAKKPPSSSCSFTFEVITNDRVWYLAAEAEGERSKWLEAIEKAIADLKTKISFMPPPISQAAVSPAAASPGTRASAPMPPPAVNTNRVVPVPPSSNPSTAAPPKPAGAQFRPELPKRTKSADLLTNLITSPDRAAIARIQPTNLSSSPQGTSFSPESVLSEQASPSQPSLTSEAAVEAQDSPQISVQDNGNSSQIPEISAPPQQSTATDQPSPSTGMRRVRRSMSSPPAATCLLDPALAGGQNAQTLAPPTPAQAPAQVETKREMIAREILQSERFYVECLQAILQHYMMPMLSATRNKTMTPIFTDEDIRHIFSNHLSLIVGVNLELLKSLESRVAQWTETQKLGDVFLTMAPFLKMYSDYGANYDVAMATLGRLMKEPVFPQLLQGFRGASGKNLPLESLLIMPIQRIPRYTLLLGELVRNTSDTHPDYSDLQKAIVSLETTTQHINDSMKRSDAINKVAGSGLEDYVAPHRILLFDGILDVKVNQLPHQKSSSKQEVRFVLFSDLLLHVPKARAKERAALLSPEAVAYLQLLWVRPHPGSSGVFELLIPKKGFLIEQKTQEEKDFVTALQRAIPSVATRQAKHVFSEDVTYDGQWLDGLMDGQGTMHQQNCGMYEGGWSRGEKHGVGKQLWINGVSYEGEWKDGVPHGQGTLSFPSGDVYVGSFAEGVRSGQGEFKYQNGDIYRGEFFQDRPHGSGTLQSVSGNYEGSFVNGVFHGEGRFFDAGGREYIGGWVNGLMEGQGEMFYSNNASYTGKWKEGKRHGKGMYRHNASNGAKMVYQGDWDTDLKCGHGQISYYDGSMYEGQWKDDHRHGIGRLGFRNNDSCGRVLYEGEWAHDRLTGKGVLTFSNGERYDGLFKDGMYHGQGVFTYADGRKVEGKWNAGVLEGKVNFALDPKADSSGSHSAKKLSGNVIAGAMSNGTLVPSTQAWPAMPLLMAPHVPQITLPPLN